jgi:hypothetical protein
MASEYAMKAALSVILSDAVVPNGERFDPQSNREGVTDQVAAVIDTAFTPLLAENENLKSMYQDCDLHRGSLMQENMALREALESALRHENHRDGECGCCWTTQALEVLRRLDANNRT